MMTDLEKIIDEIANRLQKGRDISFWQNNYQISPITNLLTKLSAFPKASVPRANFERVKNQVLDRISLPAQPVAEKPGMFASFPAFLKLATGTIGALLILISLGIGTAVTALQSVPGEAIYPLKKVVEKIELKLTRDPASKANLQIRFANARLEELETVLEKSQAGEISSDKVQKIVAQTVNDIKNSAAAALDSSATTQPNTKQVATLNKLVDLSNKQTAVLTPLLSAANITNDGQVKIVLEEALEASKISKEEAIKNIENAGLKVEELPLTDADANKVTANGKITAVNSTSISIGTATFLLTKDTEYANIKSADLKVDLTVKILGETRSDKKTYALSITLVETEKSDTKTDSQSTENTGNEESTGTP